MTRVTRIALGGIVASFSMVLISCEQNFKVVSEVHTDGSIDRTIVLAAADSDKLGHNIFGARESAGWETSIEKADSTHQGDKNAPKYDISFRKHFSSAVVANAEMNTASDTLFHIRSEFARKFRWFYTYLYYSDTYVSLNQFKKVPQADYFTREDYAFIERLPAEDSTLSKADSIYLSALNNKIFDQFATRALYEEYFDVMQQVLTKNKVEQKWMDQVSQQKERLYRQLSDKKGEAQDDEFMVTFLVDSLRVPLPKTTAVRDFNDLSAGLTKRIDLVSDANAGKFVHAIKMPWEVVYTNADSIHGAEVFWNPRVTKFLLSDYTMYAESRQLNVWAVIASFVALVVVGFVAYRRRVHP